MRQLFFTLTVVALGCGTVQSGLLTEEALVDGEPPRTPMAKETWCPPPPDFPREIMLIAEGACWVEIVATQAECAVMKREGKPVLLHGGRCWWFRHMKPKREPTSSAEHKVPTYSAR